MSETASRHLPTEIELHRKSRLLRITFDDGRRFDLPCEYLRVFSPAAENQDGKALVTGKEGVNIERIEPQGQYAVRLVFDDGHDTGIYSWDTLYTLGEEQETRWADYLGRLEAAGVKREETSDGTRHIKLLYFSYLAQKLHRDHQELDLPPSVETVSDLLGLLRRRRPGAAPLFADERLRITVNRQFAEPFTRLEDGDEVGLVPNSPVPPATPDLL